MRGRYMSMPPKARTLLVLVALLAMALAAASAPAAGGRRSADRARAHAAGATEWGISDDSPATFSDPRFHWLRMHNARLIVAWDVMYRRGELAWREEWLKAAEAAGVKPLVVFTADPKHPHWLPSASVYGKAVRLFVRSHPWVHNYTPWDEENHYLQPTAHNPKRAAQYYNVLAAHCSSCAITAADVLDEGNMASWIERFLRYANHPPIWGLHNYLDLNHGSHSQTARFLRMVPGEVWFTETGGLVWRYERASHRFLFRGEGYASRAAARLVGLASLSKRIRRIYYYQWRVPVTLSQAKRHRGVTWDSGLIDPDCKPRPAFNVIARALGHNPRYTPRAKRDKAGNCVKR
jgi:hypothetical protein